MHGMVLAIGLHRRRRRSPDMEESCQWAMVRSCRIASHARGNLNCNQNSPAFSIPPASYDATGSATTNHGRHEQTPLQSRSTLQNTWSILKVWITTEVMSFVHYYCFIFYRDH